MGIRVAVDLLGGDVSGVIDGIRAALDADADLQVVAVGPAAAAAELAADPRVVTVPTGAAIGDGDDPQLAVRARRDAPARVAVRCVRDGVADAAVCAEPLGVTTAAAEFVLGLVPGITARAVAVPLPTDAGAVVLLDASGRPPAGSSDQLVQHAMLGAAVAGRDARVGLLTAAGAAWRDDPVRSEAHELLVAGPTSYVGPVTVADVLRASCDVAVTDGFSGGLVVDALSETAPVRDAGLPAIIVGVAGIVVAARSTAAAAVAAAVALAASAARAEVTSRVAAGAAALVSRRRELAGMR